MTDLKTVLVDALTKSLATRADYPSDQSTLALSHGYTATQIGELIVLTQPKEPDWDGEVEPMALGDSYYEVALHADRLATAVRDHFLDREKVKAVFLEALDGETVDDCVDRLIAGLAGGSSE